MNILSTLKNIIVQEKTPEFKEPPIHVRLFRFLPNRMFKGHQGSVWVTRDYIEIVNVYFNTTCTQRFDFDGKLFIHLSKTRQTPKWFVELSDELAKRLNLKAFSIKYVVNSGDYAIILDSGYIIAELDKNCEPEKAFTHTEAIKQSKELGKITTRVLRNIKKLSTDEMVVMIKQLNKDLKENCIMLNENLFYED